MVYVCLSACACAFVRSCEYVDVSACACMPMSVQVRVSAYIRVLLFDTYLHLLLFVYAVAGEPVLVSLSLQRLGINDVFGCGQ